MALIKDKKLRKNLQVGAVILFFLLLLNARTGEQATYSYCRSIIGDDFLMTASDFNACYSEGACSPKVSRIVNIPGVGNSIFECTTQIFNTVQGFMIDCTNEAANGEMIVTDTPNKACASGNAVSVGTYCFKQIYKCIEEDPEKQCVDGSWQEPIANFVDNIWSDNDFDCNTKAIMAIGVVTLLFFVLL